MVRSGGQVRERIFVTFSAVLPGLADLHGHLGRGIFLDGAWPLGLNTED